MDVLGPWHHLLLHLSGNSTSSFGVSVNPPLICCAYLCWHTSSGCVRTTCGNQQYRLGKPDPGRSSQPHSLFRANIPTFLFPPSLKVHSPNGQSLEISTLILYFSGRFQTAEQTMAEVLATIGSIAAISQIGAKSSAQRRNSARSGALSRTHQERSPISSTRSICLPRLWTNLEILIKIEFQPSRTC